MPILDHIVLIILVLQDLPSWMKLMTHKLTWKLQHIGYQVPVPYRYQVPVPSLLFEVYIKCFLNKPDLHRMDLQWYCKVK